MGASKLVSIEFSSRTRTYIAVRCVISILDITLSLLVGDLVAMFSLFVRVLVAVFSLFIFGLLRFLQAVRQAFVF